MLLSFVLQKHVTLLGFKAATFPLCHYREELVKLLATTVHKYTPQKCYDPGFNLWGSGLAGQQRRHLECVLLGLVFLLVSIIRELG